MNLNNVALFKSMHRASMCLASALSSALPHYSHSADCNIYSNLCRREFGTSASPKEEIWNQQAEFTRMLRVIHRFKRYANERLPVDQRRFFISKNEFFEKEDIYPQKVIFRSNKFVPFCSLDVSPTKILRIRKRQLRIFLNRILYHNNIPSTTDIIIGSRQVFLTVLSALREENLDFLRERNLCVPSMDLEHPKSCLKELPRCQKQLFNMTKGDLIGQYGVVHLFGKGNPFQDFRVVETSGINYLVIGILFGALYKKRILFERVKNFPLDKTYKDGTMKLRLPADYGFLHPRFLYMYLELAFHIDPKDVWKVADDVSLFNFHIVGI